MFTINKKDFDRSNAKELDSISEDLKLIINWLNSKTRTELANVNSESDSDKRLEIINNSIADAKLISVLDKLNKMIAFERTKKELFETITNFLKKKG